MTDRRTLQLLTALLLVLVAAPGAWAQADDEDPFDSGVDAYEDVEARRLDEPFGNVDPFDGMDVFGDARDADTADALATDEAPDEETGDDVADGQDALGTTARDDGKADEDAAEEAATRRDSRRGLLPSERDPRWLW